jgi:hypothetical protein
MLRNRDPAVCFRHCTVRDEGFHDGDVLLGYLAGSFHELRGRCDCGGMRKV